MAVIRTKYFDFYLIVKVLQNFKMALSAQVKDAVETASQALREGLAFSARSEHTYLISSLTDILVRLESIESIDEMIEKNASSKNKSKV